MLALRYTIELDCGFAPLLFHCYRNQKEQVLIFLARKEGLMCGETLHFWLICKALHFDVNYFQGF